MYMYTYTKTRSKSILFYHYQYYYFYYYYWLKYITRDGKISCQVDVVDTKLVYLEPLNPFCQQSQWHTLSQDD